ncbi:hypothetical protein [Nocardioides ultimimeridianus]
MRDRMQIAEAGIVTGTSDTDYDLLRFTQSCLMNAARLETYLEDARRSGDHEVARLLARAQGDAVRDAEEGKALLSSRLQR